CYGQCERGRDAQLQTLPTERGAACSPQPGNGTRSPGGAESRLHSGNAKQTRTGRTNDYAIAARCHSWPWGSSRHGGRRGSGCKLCRRLVLSGQPALLVELGTFGAAHASDRRTTT